MAAHVSNIILLPTNERPARKVDQHRPADLHPAAMAAPAPKVDQHSPRVPAHESPPHLLAIQILERLKVNQCSLNDLIVLVMARIKDEHSLASVSAYPMFSVWTALDKELERRNQPVFVPLNPNIRNFSPEHNPDDEAIDRAIMEEYELKGYALQSEE